MSIQLIMLVFVLYLNSLAAQPVKPAGSYSVKAGEIPTSVLPNEAMYVLPSFTIGTALMRNGTSSIQRFNYNFLLGEMHFINDTGDTLAIAEPLLFRSIIIDSMVFYYDKGYVREIFNEGNYKLAIKQEMVQVAEKARGAYDASSGTGAIRTFGSITNNSQLYKLQVKKDALFQQVVSFYIGNGLNPFFKANKRNFHILFAEKNIAAYLKEHAVNFNKEEDLKALLQFCVQ